ncbi:MAG: hypothetical protein KIT81_13795 [Alphaproteobacteria bacterium]|nr:hypothetical protein [Alphaproteobacteria bacterium]
MAADIGWRAAGTGGRSLILLALLAAPGLAALRAGRALARHGAAARQAGGPVPARQFLAMLGPALLLGLPPAAWYRFGLFRPEAGGASDYLTRELTRQGLYPMIGAGVQGEAGRLLADRFLFSRHALRHGLPMARLALAAEPSGLIYPETALELPALDLFVKPRRGRVRGDTERWDYAGEGRWLHPSGDSLGEGELVARFVSLAKRRGRGIVVEQQARNHPDIIALSGRVLATVRVLTWRGEAGRIEASDAILRMATARRGARELSEPGRIGAPIDLESGRLGEATDLASAMPGPRLARHPNTGADIAGRLLPFWPEARALAIRAHASLPAGAPLVGWDLAITAEGPVLIEANPAPGLDMLQRAKGRGLAAGRFGELLEERLKVLL